MSSITELNVVEKELAHIYRKKCYDKNKNNNNNNKRGFHVTEDIHSERSRLRIGVRPKPLFLECLTTT